VIREPEIRMAKARIISAPATFLDTQNQPNRNDVESGLPKWYTNSERNYY
jgi:hypothetical protein